MDPLTAAVFLAGASLIALISLLLGERNRRLEDRFHGLAEGKQAKPGPLAQLTETTMPVLAKPLMPVGEKEQTLLKSRLLHAGLYHPHALAAFLAVKMLLIVGPVVIGLGVGLSGAVPIMHGLIYGLLASVIGILGPNLWLNWRRARRQTELRRALPDALDMIVLCLDGGLSLQAALQRVGGEIRMVSALLADELGIVLREIHLGRSTGEALRQFADRCNLEEVRSLASVILQSERLGASVAKALHVHAESLRMKRLHRAEELAYTAGTKMLIPLILFIFPVLLYVVAGPAMFHIIDLFSSIQR